MDKKIYFISCLFFLMGCASTVEKKSICLTQNFSKHVEVDVKFFETPIDRLMYLSINHAQGSLSFQIDGVHYFYYMPLDTSLGRILASSKILDDLRNATTVQVKHVSYGLHRKIINLLIFYGEREIPEGLKIKN